MEEVIHQGKFDGKAFVDRVNAFLYTCYYPIAVALVIFLCWFFCLQMVGLSIIVLVACLIFLFKRDLTPFVPLLFSVIMVFTDLSVIGGVALYIILAPAVVCFIVHFIRFHHKMTLGKLFFPLIAVSAALFLGGIGSITSSYYLGSIVRIVSTGLLLLAVYLVFRQSLNPPKNFDLKKYTCTSIITTVTIACFQVFCLFFVQKVLSFDLPTVFEKAQSAGGFNLLITRHGLSFTRASNYGWGNGNSLGALLLLAIPICHYMLVKVKKTTIFAILILFFYMSVVLTGSDGALICAIIMSPLLFIYTYRRLSLKNKKLYSSICLLLALIIVLYSLIEYVLYSCNIIGTLPFGILQKAINLLSKGIDGNGRELLYNESISCFLKNPIFGAGLGFVGKIYSVSETAHSYSFHSTIFEVLGTMGIVGVLAYTYYFVARIKLLNANYSNFNLFAFLGFVGFEIYSIVDVGEFMIIPTMIIITVLLAVVEIYNGKSESRFIPLNNKNYPVLI